MDTFTEYVKSNKNERVDIDKPNGRKYVVNIHINRKGFLTAINNTVPKNS